MRWQSHAFRAAAVAAAALTAACTRDLGPSSGPAPFPSTDVVFTDDFSAGVGFQAFGGSKLDAISVDGSTHANGSASLKVVVPALGDPSGGYAGGALVDAIGRDLSGYNALTFWARASMPVNFDVVGLGNDNTGTSRFDAHVAGLPLTTAWKKYVIPIPLPARLTRERGLFYFASGPVNGAGYTVWFDEIRYEQLSTIGNVRPVIGSRTFTDEVGATVGITGTAVTYAAAGSDVRVIAAPGYFTFSSSNTGVATPDSTGTVKLVGPGTATVTATLGSAAASGSIAITAVAPPNAAPPQPTHPASDVISLHGSHYTNVPVDTWSATWDLADVNDVTVGGESLKKYTNVSYAGIEFGSAPVDARAMSFLHLDVWAFDTGSFKVKLVDFGSDGAFGGGNDTESEVTITTHTTPALVAGGWSSLDIPLSAFTGLAARGHLAQIVLSGSSSTFYLGNVYFFRASVPDAPTAPAPAPTPPASQVISLNGGSYTNVAVDTWRTDWSNATETDVALGGHTLRKYTNLVFAGIEMVAHPVDASAMTGFHMDIWTPSPTALPAVFKVKLVDFGADGAFGGGDDVEHELSFTAATTPALATGSWVALDVPLSAFTNLTTRSHIAQIVISGDLPTVYVDNVYFYNAATPPTAPTTPGPTPTYPAANVISLSSAAYTNVPVDTWRTDWSDATETDVTLGGATVHEYTNLVFAGIETVAHQIDASAMTHFRMDIWTPDPTAPPKIFKIKLVDFGANGAFGGGDDVEHEVTLTATSTPAIGTGQWMTLDIPLSAFTGLVTRQHIAQLIISGDLRTVYIDNVLFHK